MNESIRLLALLLLGLSSAVSAGCRSKVLTNDQQDFRARLLDLYTDQILDNLIRARQGMPFVQLDYTNFTGTVTDTGNGSFALNSPGSSTSSTIGANRVAQLTVTGNPVVDKPQVYQAYLDYLEKYEDGLIESPEAPPAGAYLACKCFCDSFWWIPIDRRKEFQQLSMQTTTVRSATVVEPEEFEANIVEAAALPGNPNLPLQQVVEITFDKDLPRLRGKLRVAFDEKLHLLTIQPQKGEEANNDKKFRLLFAKTAPSEKDSAETYPFDGKSMAEKVKGRRAWIRFENYSPEPSAEKQALDAIFHQQELQRLSTFH